MKTTIRAGLVAAMSLVLFTPFAQEAPGIMDDLPQSNPSHRVANLAPLNSRTVVALAKSVLDKGALKLDFILKGQLDKMVADTSINVAGTGIFLLVSGLPRYAGEYLVCKDVMAHPQNPWSINDLGVIMRGYKDYAAAAQCFLYAGKLKDSSAIFKTNAGWALAYYGDFTAAKKYFNEALGINESFTSALEGLSTIAFSEGNIRDVFQALAKQVKGVSAGGGGGGAPGPSESFVRLCGTAEIQSIDLSGKTKEDPTGKDAYDGSGDAENADEYTIANDEPPTYPSFQPIFVRSLDDLQSAVFTTIEQRMLKERQKLAALAKEKRASLPPLIRPPYMDEQGNRIIPMNYSKWVELFGNVTVLFSQRLSWVMDKYSEKMSKLVEDIGNHDGDLVKAYSDALGKCNGDKDCIDQVQCKFVPIFKSAKSSDIAAAYRVWGEYYDKILAQVRWYVNATSPFIRKVRELQWNGYLNFERERQVRLAIIDMYAKWKEALDNAYNSGAVATIATTQVSCPIEARGIPSSNPSSKKLPKLKTFAGPCYKEKTTINLKVATYSDDCDQTKIVIGNGPVKAFFEKNYSKKFKEDDYYRAGISVGVSEEIKGKIGALKGKAELSAEASAFYKFDSYGNLTEKGVDVDLAAAAQASVETGLKPLDKNLQLMKGIEAHFTVSTLCGQNQSPDYRITNFSAEKQSKGFK